jgi:hypothetical protein
MPIVDPRSAQQLGEVRRRHRSAAGNRERCGNLDLGQLAETARVLLWGLAVVDLGYFAWWKKHYLTRAALLDRAKQAKLFSALEEHEGPVEERAAFVVSTYVTRKVVLFAIIDALAVYGLVLAIVGRYVADQYLLSALTLILLILEFPSQRLASTTRKTPPTSRSAS